MDREVEVGAWPEGEAMEKYPWRPPRLLSWAQSKRGRAPRRRGQRGRRGREGAEGRVSSCFPVIWMALRAPQTPPEQIKERARQAWGRLVSPPRRALRVTQLSFFAETLALVSGQSPAFR